MPDLIPPTSSAPDLTPELTHDPVANAARDLGFGSRVAADSRLRLINKDGTFNVKRRGLSAGAVLSPYHALISMSWRNFLIVVVCVYLVINALFAGAYVMCGADALAGPTIPGVDRQFGDFLRAFFFSVETFGTIGYGHVAPIGLDANVIITIESILSLISIGLTTGLTFARFSRPTARILYSRNSVIAPYRDVSGFMFRCANARNSQLIDVNVRVLYSRIEEKNGVRTRQFTPLPLEYDRVTFFTLSWTVVHPITPDSPLYNRTHADLIANGAEFLILMSGVDQTFVQTVLSQTSYKSDEVVWGAKFQPMFIESVKAGVNGMDLSRIHDIEPAVLP